MSSGQKITDKKIPVQQAALFSALVSVEEAAGMRVSLGVNAAGEAARVRLKYGVTPLLSPTAEQFADLRPLRMRQHFDPAGWSSGRAAGDQARLTRADVGGARLPLPSGPA